MSEAKSGDSFTNISNATIVNRSTLTNALNIASKNGDEELKVALNRVASLVEQSNSVEAGELFNSFAEELQKPQPRKTLLSATWDGLVKALPAVAAVGGAVSAIAKLWT
jgi:hypothetical protein